MATSVYIYYHFLGSFIDFVCGGGAAGVRDNYKSCNESTQSLPWSLLCFTTHYITTQYPAGLPDAQC